MKSKLFSLESRDFIKGAVMAAISAVLLPVAAMIQTPEFSIFSTDWKAVGVLAANSAIVGFCSYIVKNFLSDENGKVFGKI